MSPQFVAAAVAFVANALITVGVGNALAYGIAKLVIQIAITVAIGAATRALQPKPKAMDQGTELRTKLDPALPREVAVGTFSTGGSIAFLNSQGTNNVNLWQVIALSDYEIQEITKVRGNGEDLTFSGDFHTAFRDCTSHFKTAAGASCLSMRIYKGTQSQTHDADLIAAFPSLLDTNFRGRGIAYAIMKMVWDADAWAGGSEFVFIGKGAPCLDPRTGLSAWTENLALITNQFLRGFTNNGIRVVGLGAATADLPDAEMCDAADDCDDDIALAAGGTEKRYRGGGMISARETPREVLVHLMAGMAGRHVDRGGEIVILPGVARTPIFTASQTSEDEMLADEAIAFAARRTADERFNAIASTFVDPADGYQEGPTPPRKDADAILADGGRIDTSRAYRYVQSKTQAQRLDQIELRRCRAEKWVAFSAPLWGFEMTPGDWFEAASPRWRNETVTFEVETADLTITSGSAGGEPMARCAFSARETSAYVFEWSTADEITLAAGALTVPALPSLALAGFVLTEDSVTVGGSIMPELRFAWTAVANSLAEKVEVQYRRTAATTILYSATFPAADAAGAARNGVYPGVAYEARARLRAGAREGEWTSWASPVTTDGIFQATEIDGQGDLAVLDNVHDYQLLPLNASGGVAGSFDAQPLSGVGTQINVAAVVWTGVGGTISVDSGSYSGLSASTKYWFFWDTVGATHAYTSTYATAQGYYSDPTRYLALGARTTSGGGGGGGAGGLVP